MSDRLKEIEERWAKTTPGPWWPDMDNLLVIGSGSGPTMQVAVASTRANRDAIAASPEDIAHLIAEVKRLRRELALYLEGE